MTTPTHTPSIESLIALEIHAKTNQVQSAITLLDEGATVPFIARYRKEATGGLDDEQLRTLEQRLSYLRELESRKETILASIESQGKMTPDLRLLICETKDKARLEELYLPYKPKRRTKAQVAIEAGLEVLADTLLKHPETQPAEEALKYVCAPFEKDGNKNPGVPDSDAALEGARAILIERFSEHPTVLETVRGHMLKHGVVQSETKKPENDPEKTYADYYAYTEPLVHIPSHRALALLRAEKEEVISLQLRLQTEKERPKSDAPMNMCEKTIAQIFHIEDKGRAADAWLLYAVRLAWKAKVSAHTQTELFAQLREHAEEEAIRVFAKNLKELLLAAPAGHKRTLGLDPGFRTGVKVAIIDETGKVLHVDTIYPHDQEKKREEAKARILDHIHTYGPTLIAIGNGTASRETDAFVQEIFHTHKELSLTKVFVSEAGASVYSASPLATKELPHLDVSHRGAVSIARRLQDPLAELVKIDPKAIGVGQYQHDVNQGNLGKALRATVEDCVNAVGVDVNTASPQLLSYVSGISETLAENVVSYRETHGAFPSRKELLRVPRFGEKAFEQAAGFLRIPDGTHPLDASGVHPETYAIVERMAKDAQCSMKDLIGNTDILRTINPQTYVDAQFGLPTLKDILSELEKPGRDPRPEFKTAAFLDGVHEMKDLRVGMQLEGVITNVAAFGAFVDIGVHQDGLVHISQLSDTFVTDPHAVVKVGQIVSVRVTEVDTERKRIALTMKKKHGN